VTLALGADGRPARLLAVDDAPANLRLLRAVLEPHGYEVATAADGTTALALAPSADLVLLDVHLPDLSGFEVCQRLRADPATAALPVVMVTATAAEQRLRGLEVGADDFLTKPFDQAELLVRVRSLLRVKRYHDELQQERAALAETVEAQVAELAAVSAYRRFLPDHLVHAIAADEGLLAPHRREVAVLFADLRGFTAFSATAEPEDVVELLRGWHALVGEVVRAEAATVGYLAGDGVMLFWNDPLRCDDPAGRAARAAFGLVAGLRTVEDRWSRLGYAVGVGVGLAVGYATIGMMGFDGRYDYTAVGPVVNLAARLSAEARDGRTVLLDQRAHAALEEHVTCEAVPGGVELRGYQAPVPAWVARPRVAVAEPS
jgi:CheY-like chemotaxis protein